LAVFGWLRARSTKLEFVRLDGPGGASAVPDLQDDEHGEVEDQHDDPQSQRQDTVEVLLRDPCPEVGAADMTNNFQQTSAAPYASLEDLGERQTAVRHAISAMGAACNAKIAKYLDVPINQVTGRVFELRDKGLVREAYKAVWPATGRTVIWWETV
jgi:hypothetical protein